VQALLILASRRRIVRFQLQHIEGSSYASKCGRSSPIWIQIDVLRIILS